MRLTLEHTITKERRSVLLPTSFGKRWRVVETERTPEQPKQPRADDLIENKDPELLALALQHDTTVQVLLDNARTKFGRNVSVSGLMHLIKVRGL